MSLIGILIRIFTGSLVGIRAYLRSLIAGIRIKLLPDIELVFDSGPDLGFASNRDPNPDHSRVFDRNPGITQVFGGWDPDQTLAGYRNRL